MLPPLKPTSHICRHQRIGCLLRNSMATRSEDQCHQQQHEREIEPGKHGRIDVGKRREQRAAAGDEPDFVAVPHRADGVEHDAPLFVFLGEEMQRADAEVEAVEHRVAGEQHADQDEPDRVEIQAESKFMLAGAPAFRDGSRSASSGPCWILSFSKYTNTAKSRT